MSSKFIDYDFEIPNPGMAKWLLGPECREGVTKIAREIYTIYANTIPHQPTGNLVANAYYEAIIGGEKNDRYIGVVGNRAESYRGQKGKPYARYVEGGTSKMPAQHQFQRAVEAVTGQIWGGQLAVPGLRYNPKGRGSKIQGPDGRFLARPRPR